MTGVNLLPRCEFCGKLRTLTPRTRRYCSRECRYYAMLKRQEVTRKVHRFSVRVGPSVMRALALTNFPYLRTAAEQKALDRWLDERIATGVVGWANLAADIRGV
ncbi:MAG TPA: hypothetical protein VNN79_20255 [Actinomycetota bacterium]|nr:hypothetical protein [Actinomycetota bacterium]